MEKGTMQVEEGLARGGVLELPPIATRPEVAEYTRISVPTLARWASEMPPRGPKFKKAGGRVLYKRQDVLDWIDSLEESA